ncbi:hypothetical protein [Enterococcus olivae]
MIKLLILSNLFLSVSASPLQHHNEPIVEYASSTPLAHIIDWRLKVVDGKIYKRLYNYTLKEWVGDWILA